MIVIFSVQLLYAGGASENRFKHIDELISQKNYNQALVLLEEYIRKNPTDFDNAQRRIKKIIGARSTYNTVADDLIDVIINDPTNDVKKLSMIALLEQMETNPNTGAQNFILETKVAAQFTYFRALFEKIMLDGSDLVKSGKYTQAARMFHSGFTLYRDDFYAQGYDETFIAPINASLKRVGDMLVEYERIQTSTENLLAAFILAVNSGNYTQAQAAFIPLSAALQEFANMRNTTAAAGWQLQNSFGVLSEKNPAITEASYLPFVYRFTLGRSSDPLTGILGAIDAQWNSFLYSMKTATYTTILAQWKSAFNRLEPSIVFIAPARHDEARRDIALSVSFTNIGKQVNALHSLLEKSAGQFMTASPSFNAGMDFSAALAEAAVRELDTIRDYAAVTMTREAPFAAGALSTVFADTREILLFFSQTATSLEQFANQSQRILHDTEQVYTTYTKSFPADAPNFSVPYNDVTKLCAIVYESSQTQNAQNTLKLAAYVRGGAETIAATYEKNYGDAKLLAAGMPDATTGKLNKYPDQARKQITETLSSIQRDAKVIDELYAELVKMSVSDTYRAEYGEQLALIQSAVASLSKVSAEGRISITQIDGQLLQSGKALQEAEMRLAQASQALARAEYQLARDNLQLARQRYNQVLEIQESAELRASADAKLTALGERIMRAENEIVITQVRALIIQAKTAYYAGNFEMSDRLLNQAKTRWEVTNVEPNPEIIQWLTLTGTAISRMSGRTIPVTAPLYPEMSQLLSVANQLYDQGSALMSAGKKTEANAALDSAKQKIREVQLVYPLNQEAGLLALKIDKLIDPRAFDASFKNRFDTAMRDYKNANTQQNAYADLLDLALINPNYSGIRAAINTVEIYLGIKLPPPDPQAIARSNALIAQARTAANSSNEIELRTAIARLDEALKFTPNNDDAALLKDRLQNRVGGQAVAVLSSESERLYQQAVQELQRNNVINAASLLAQLMQNPNNRKSPKILDLQQRVNTLTGQVN